MRGIVAFTLYLIAACAMAQSTQQPFVNVVTFDANATAEVPSDTLTVTLFAEEQGPDPSELASRVNARIEQGLAKAKAEPGMQARSGRYQTNPLYDRANQITGWRIRAEVIVQGRDFKAVGALAGRLQPVLKLGSMAFSLSPAAREQATATLLTEALDKYQKKAKQIAATLGFPGYTLSQIAVHSEGAPVQPMYRAGAMAAMADSGPAPVPVEGGDNTVTVTVSGSVVLGPGK